MGGCNPPLPQAQLIINGVQILQQLVAVRDGLSSILTATNQLGETAAGLDNGVTRLENTATKVFDKIAVELKQLEQRVSLLEQQQTSISAAIESLYSRGTTGTPGISQYGSYGQQYFYDHRGDTSMSLQYHDMDQQSKLNEIGQLLQRAGQLLQMLTGGQYYGDYSGRQEENYQPYGGLESHQHFGGKPSGRYGQWESEGRFDDRDYGRERMGGFGCRDRFGGNRDMDRYGAFGGPDLSSIVVAYERDQPWIEHPSSVRENGRGRRW